ncbi:ABC transporter substrate-binding protein [Kitasatospora sp. GP82]|uniref:ABC transporter substrate-binding protein n=1 Tax=Kitasatospora sp. GP82 TaxID=3035089 RepID=UPI00247316AF|nr:ABC transporter substrate-binding protein [Kitasatospora sp. GP82]
MSVGGLLLSGCGSSTTPGSDHSASDLRNRLPGAIREAGVLRIASYLNYPPVDFKGQDGEPAGIDPDLASALGSRLGLKVEFEDMPFENVIPSVQAKKVDLGMSAVIDTKQRQDGIDDNGRPTTSGVDFIDYFVTGTSILVKNGNPLGISTLDNLCGHTIAVQRGTVQDEIAQRQVGACAKGDKTLQIDELKTDDQALAEVTAGTAVADLNDFPVAEYNTSQHSGRFLMAGGSLQSGPYGITVNKDSADLEYVLARTLDQLIQNGQYDRILGKWSVTSGQVSSAVTNGGL